MNNKNKTIIAAASFYTKKYFFDQYCNTLPDGTKSEIMTICQKNAEMTRGVFYIGINDNGNVFFSSEGMENDFDYDEISAKSIVDKASRENEPLVKSIQLWHALYKTEQGAKIREKIKQKL